MPLTVRPSRCGVSARIHPRLRAVGSARRLKPVEDGVRAEPVGNDLRRFVARNAVDRGRSWRLVRVVLSLRVLVEARSNVSWHLVIRQVVGSTPTRPTTVRDLRLVVTTVSLREPPAMITVSYGRLFRVSHDHEQRWCQRQSRIGQRS